MAANDVLEITDANFETEVIKSDVPVLVDFWAEWCMPCRMLAPTIEKVASDYSGRIKVGKLDTDANRQAAVKYGITNIPTVMLFKAGDVHTKLVGLKTESDFKTIIDKALAD